MPDTRHNEITTTWIANQTKWTDKIARRVVMSLDTQAYGALQALGHGVLPIPDEDSFKVAAGVGLSVAVGAGAGIAPHPVYDAVFLQTFGSIVVSGLEANRSAEAPIYIYAQIQINDTADINANDSRETGLPLFSASDFPTLDNALPLAEVTTGAAAVESVTDLREFVKTGGGAALFDPASPQPEGLFWGYKSGRVRNGTSVVEVPAGEIALTTNATNYVEVSPSGTVSANTSAFSAANIPLRVLVTNATRVTSSADKRALGGATGGAGGVLSGTYPNPGFAVDMATQSELDTHKTSGDHDGRYYTETETDALLADKANATHNHDDRYYTETETDAQLSNKADLVSGKVPAEQLPSYVDDVEEYADLDSFPDPGESGKLYLALDTNLVYRWAGTTYAVTSSSLALGETSGTAYRGDRGKIAYDHSQEEGNPHNTQIADIPGLSEALETSGDGVSTPADFDPAERESTLYADLENILEDSDTIESVPGTILGQIQFRLKAAVARIASTLGANQVVETDADGKLISVAKGTAHNKSFGTTSGTVCEGDDPRIAYAGAYVYKSANQTIPDSENTLVTFNSELWDSHGFHDNSTNNERLTIPSGMGGIYQVCTRLWLDGGHTWIVALKKNTVAYTMYQQHLTEDEHVEINTQMQLAAGDYVAVQVFHGAGADIVAYSGPENSSFQIRKIG